MQQFLRARRWECTIGRRERERPREWVRDPTRLWPYLPASNNCHTLTLTHRWDWYDLPRRCHSMDDSVCYDNWPQMIMHSTESRNTESAHSWPGRAWWNLPARTPRRRCRASTKWPKCGTRMPSCGREREREKGNKSMHWWCSCWVICTNGFKCNCYRCQWVERILGDFGFGFLQYALKMGWSSNNGGRHNGDRHCAYCPGLLAWWNIENCSCFQKMHNDDEDGMSLF